nr:unnamed protein product [Callosobruchus chinensis]
MKQHQAKAVAVLKSGQGLVMTRLGEQRQAVSRALENQDQHISAVGEQLQQVKGHKHVEEQLSIVREELRELSASERSLTAVAPPSLDRHNVMVAKPYPYDGKTSRDVYYLQFDNTARMNNWSDEKKACAERFCSSYFGKSILV